jgi:putative tryptophan/tyrosine transport system substrate-binding protein
MIRSVARVAGWLMLVAALAPAPCALAQQAARQARIGVLVQEPHPALDSLREGLRELGHVEGQTLRIDYRWGEGRYDRYPALAAELVALGVDAIVAWGSPATLAAKQATTTIPIIVIMGDPIGVGAVTSLARPGGNVTGLSTMNVELEEKRLELLKDLVPRLARVAVVMNPTNPYADVAIEHVRRAAAAMRLTLETHAAADAEGLDPMFDALRRSKPDAVLVFADTLLLRRRSAMVNVMAESRLPAIYAYREYVEVGGLISYATDFPDLFRRAASYVDKVLTGAKPGDLPIQQPAKFRLSINLRTADVLGLKVPPDLLDRADEVIE